MSASRILTAVCAAALATAVVTRAAEKKTAPASADVMPFRAAEKTLSNGLKVIVVPTGFPNIVSRSSRGSPALPTSSST